MFTAQKDDGSIVCALDYQEEERDTLRNWAQENRFICPACAKTLNIRMGDRNKWHFCHKGEDPEYCPLKSIDAEEVEAMVCMYKWLKSKPAVLEVLPEYSPPEVDLAAPIELFFRTKKQKYIYKIIWKRVPSDLITEIESLRDQYVVNYVFLEKSIRAEDGVYKFGPTHRECYQYNVNVNRDNKYYGAFQRDTRHIVAIDPENQRFLKLTKANRVRTSKKLYAADCEEIPLAVAAIKPSNGEIVFRGNN